MPSKCCLVGPIAPNQKIFKTLTFEQLFLPDTSFLPRVQELLSINLSVPADNLHTTAGLLHCIHIHCR